MRKFREASEDFNGHMDTGWVEEIKKNVQYNSSLEKLGNIEVNANYAGRVKVAVCFKR